jgi:hypothetical protein
MSLKNMAVAKAIFANDKVSVTKSCLGLCTKVTYVPTQSRIKAIQNDYNTDNGELLMGMLRTPDDKLESVINSMGTVEKAAIGNIRLEGCVSEDQQFVAIQLFRYADFQYVAATDVKFYEGEQAKLVSALL